MSIDNHSDIQRYAMVGPAPAIGSFFDWRRAHIQEPSWADTLSPADDVRTKQTGAYLVGRFALAEPCTSSWAAVGATGKPNRCILARAANTGSESVHPYAGLTYDINDTYTAYASYTEIFQPQNARDTSGGILPPHQRQEL